MTFELAGPVGRLEALVDEPRGLPRAAVVLAHPHPDHGGSMRTRVVYEAAQAFVRVGAAVLRFNYRGVGTSQGRFTGGHGEMLDFSAALDALAHRCPASPLWTAGYSFGAWVAMAVGAADPRVTAILAIAPPLCHHDFSRAAASPATKVIIQAERDEVCPLTTARQYYATLAEPRELVVIDGADHAFSGRASEVAEAIEDLFGRQPTAVS
jgi:hypothetical protein